MTLTEILLALFFLQDVLLLFVVRTFIEMVKALEGKDDADPELVELLRRKSERDADK